MRRALLSLALLCACNAPSASSPFTSTPLPSTFFGLDLEYDGPDPHGVPWPNDVGFDAHQIVRMFLAGGGLWADVHRAGRGEAFDWRGIDDYVSVAAQHEQRVLYVVMATPAFAVAPAHRSTLCAWPSLYPGGCNPPDDWDATGPDSCMPPAGEYVGPNCAFKEFAVALVRRYRAHGVQEGCPDSDPQCHGVIHFYELWNEVDSYAWPDTRFWAGEAPGDETASREDAFEPLVAMAAAMAEVIRREDAGAQMIGPSFTSSDGAAAMEAFYSQPDIDPEWFDAMSFHGYYEVDVAHSPSLVRDLIDGYLDARQSAARVHPSLANKPLWDTEGGFGMNYAPVCQPVGDCLIDPDAQTAYLARWYLHHWDAGIDNATWFHWGNNGWGEMWCPDGASSENHWVGCDRLDSDEPQVNATGVAYQTLRKWLGDALRTAPCHLDGGVWSCAVELPDGEGVIVWAQDDRLHVVAVAHETVEGLDGVSRVVENGKVEVGALPVLVR